MPEPKKSPKKKREQKACWKEEHRIRMGMIRSQEQIDNLFPKAWPRPSPQAGRPGPKKVQSEQKPKVQREEPILQTYV